MIGCSPSSRSFLVCYMSLRQRRPLSAFTKSHPFVLARLWTTFTMSYLCLRYFKMMWRSLALLTLFATLAAAGIDRLVAPRIIEPNECTVWQSGETVIISWCVRKGRIVGSSLYASAHRVWPSWNALPKDKAILALGTLEAGASEQYVKLGEFAFLAVPSI